MYIVELFWITLCQVRRCVI